MKNYYSENYKLIIATDKIVGGIVVTTITLVCGFIFIASWAYGSPQAFFGAMI